jgi:hypothetical protein
MNLTINGRQVTVDDSFRDLPREDQEAAVEHIADSMPKKEASGVAAGAIHGAMEPIHGAAETLKRFAGVGPGRQDYDPNYVPADVTHGSWNPANWSLSQLPQKVAEMAPSMVPDVAAGAVGAKAGKSIAGVKGAALGALLGSTLSGWARTAGDTVKEATAARTGDANTESNTADLVRGGATAGAASLAGSLLPTRFVPGVNGVTKDVVGASGALDAVKKYLATSALGGVGAVGSNAATQAGLTVGTDKGLTVDPSQFPEAAVGGAATGAVLAAPKLAGDAVRAGTLAKFGGENLLPTKNVATRLEAASEKLGNAKSDEAALKTVMSDLTNELGDAANKVRKQIHLSPEADNALVRAQRGDKITPDEVQLIKQETAAAPDGANAAFLAHSIHAANLMAERGGHSNRGWAGGISGVMDKNLGFLLNPARLAGGAAATMLGMHLLGTSNPLFGGALAGTYVGSRLIDSAAGMRSPAKTFAEHFADHSAQLRLPTTPQAPVAPPAPPPQAAPWGPRPPMSGPTGPTVSPPAPPPGVPAGPWGPRPLATTSVPPVAAPLPPAPAAPPPPAAPQINPMALAMLKQKLKAGLPPEPAPAPPAPAPAAPQPSFNPMALQMLKQKLKEGLPAEPQPAPAPAPAAPQPSFNPMALQMLKQKLKEGLPAEPQPAPAPAAPVTPSPVAPPAPSIALPNDISRNSKLLMAGMAKVAKMKADATAGTGEPASLSSAAAPNPGAPKTMADILRNVTSDVQAPKKIKKSNGKVEEEAAAPVSDYEPLHEEHLYPKDITPEAYAVREAAEYGARSPSYLRKAEASARARIDAETALIEQFPSSYPRDQGSGSPAPPHRCEQGRARTSRQPLRRPVVSRRR